MSDFEAGCVLKTTTVNLRKYYVFALGHFDRAHGRYRVESSDPCRQVHSLDIPKT